MSQAEAYQLELERQYRALDALKNCENVGANAEDLRTLAGEIGISRAWENYRNKPKETSWADIRRTPEAETFNKLPQEATSHDVSRSST